MPPTGPRASRGRNAAAPRGAPKGPSRGGIQKRKAGGPTKVDEDGDLVMDAATGAGRGRGRGRGGGHNHNNTQNGNDVLQKAPARGILNGAQLQKAIAQGMATGSANIRGPKSDVKMEGVIREATTRSGKGRNTGLEQISVRGHKQSKAASNPDGGVKDLLAFLERKASGNDTPANETVRIRKSRPEGDALIISVRSEDVPKILRLNNFQFAGAQLSISPHDGPHNKHDNTPTQPSKDAIDTRQKMEAFLQRRYDPSLKLLNLSALGQDTELVNMGMFSKLTTQSKFFPALMKICDGVFTSAQQKREAIVSVTLSNNELQDISPITTLAQTFPDLKNLDLSGNKIRDMKALESWRWKFRHLEHLVLSDNPILTLTPNYKDELMKWYSTLRILDGVQVRSEEEVAAAEASRRNAAKGTLPISVQPPDFRDEGQIGENFVKRFFLAYDSDRNTLATSFYDAKSTFSLSVNTSAPRVQGTGPQHDKIRPQNWDAYIKKSRNLLKINHLPARMSRTHTGTDSIRECWVSLPATRHPDLMGEPQKWLIECHSLPGLPDPSGQSPTGVGGLIVMVHGEFQEIATQAPISRSFDRTFVLGPGGGLDGIRVISDILVLRAYGGSEAWVPGGPEPTQPAQNQQQIPEGFGVQLEGKSQEVLQQEMMLVEMCKQTGMTLEYARMCLEQSAWQFSVALANFENVKGNLPADAFF